MKDPRSKSTATSENALTPEERDAFLMGDTPLVTRLSTIRPDGWAHTAPAWYWWTGEHFVHSIGPGRVHLRNLAGDTRITECIDIDLRPGGGGPGERAAAAVCFGTATVIADPDAISEWTERLLDRYLGPEAAAQYLQFSIAEIEQGRRLVRVTPTRWLTWDYGKVD